MRILIIEPDRELGRTIATALETKGHTVMVRRDAQTGLDGLDYHNPDLVLLELQLGKHNGVEFLQEQQSHTDWQEIPVIVHTLNSHALEPEYQNAWRELGVKQILYKPATSLSRLQKIIDQTVL